MPQKEYTQLQQENVVTDKLFGKMKTLFEGMGTFNDQLCRFSMVPKILKSSNKEAYVPTAVSMGPRYNGYKELQYMEEIKLRCMLSLLHRVGEGQAVLRLEKCCQAFCNLDELIRANYLGDIYMEKQELVQIMLVDGCFLLELLITKGFDCDLPCRLYTPTPTAPQVLQNNDVLSDLTLFENQIPIFIVHKLWDILFDDHYFQQDVIQRATLFNNLVLSILGYSQSQLDVQNIHALHILDIVHCFVNGKGERQSKIENRNQQEHDHVVDISDTQNQKPRVVKLKLKRCALRLITAGVTIKAIVSEDKDSELDLSCFSMVLKSLRCMLCKICNILLMKGKHLDLDDIPEEVEMKGLDFYFKFEKEKGKLEIEQLHITKTTKAKWCNLIAWEYYKMYQDASLFDDESRKTSKTASGGHVGGKFTWAALLFNGLICSEDDVQFLKDKKIVVDHVKMSNQELMEFFRKIQLGVDPGVVDSGNYIQMIDDINDYSKAFFVKRIWSTVWNSFTYRQEWLLRFLNHNYNFVAALISLCTVVQTIYAIIAYQLPK